jgi:hypothetical protein
MTDLIDIYRAAKLVIDRDGEDAQLYAAARMVVLAGEGDAEGAARSRRPLRSCSGRGGPTRR